jgi:hypothetical protein
VDEKVAGVAGSVLSQVVGQERHGVALCILPPLGGQGGQGQWIRFEPFRDGVQRPLDYSILLTRVSVRDGFLRRQRAVLEGDGKRG